MRAATHRPTFEFLEDRSVPATFTVLNLGDGGDGSLRQAVEGANAFPGADDIRFADGLQGTIALTGGQLSITDHLTIDGPGAGLLAVSGNRQSRVFNISGGAVVGIDDLTITGGQVVGDGGGILNTGGTLTLDRVVLTDNHAVATTSNTLGRGGAIANMSGATLTVADCQFTGNQARGGGPGPAGQSLTVRCGAGIYNQSSVLTVVRSAFTGNLSIGGPAGVRAQDSRGAYMGASIGQASYRHTCDGAPAGIACDNNDTAWRLFLGYQFNRRDAIELGFHSLGTPAATGSGPAAVTETADLSAIDFLYAGTWPIGNRFSLLTKLGFYFGKAEANPAPPGTPMRSTFGS